VSQGFWALFLLRTAGCSAGRVPRGLFSVRSVFFASSFWGLVLYPPPLPPLASLGKMHFLVVAHPVPPSRTPLKTVSFPRLHIIPCFFVFSPLPRFSICYFATPIFFFFPLFRLKFFVMPPWLLPVSCDPRTPPRFFPRSPQVFWSFFRSCACIPPFLLSPLAAPAGRFLVFDYSFEAPFSPSIKVFLCGCLDSHTVVRPFFPRPF